MMRIEQHEFASLKKADLISALREAHQEVLDCRTNWGNINGLEVPCADALSS